MDAETLLHRHVRLVETTEGQFADESACKNGQKVANIESHDRQHTASVLVTDETCDDDGPTYRR
jgi:hypothetical protein